MKRFVRLFSLLLTLVLVLNLVPAVAFAETPQEPEEPAAADVATPEPSAEEPAAEVVDEAITMIPTEKEMSWENPLYAGMDLPKLPAAELKREAETRASFVNFETAVNNLAAKMRGRNATATIYTYVPKESGMSYVELAEYAEESWAVALVAAMVHQRDNLGSYAAAAGGDYLAFHVVDVGGAVGYDPDQPNKLYLELKYEFVYLTTREQESQVDSAVTNLVSQLSIGTYSDKTESMKIQAIYDYLTENVAYEQEAVDINDITAYGALVEKSATGYGFALAFYRIAVYCGIDTRLITGAGRGNGHAWNIVKIGDYFYNIDSAWDAERRQAGQDYAYYLKTDANFPDHQRDEAFLLDVFCQEHPMAPEDYPVHLLGFGKCGDDLTWELGTDKVLTISGTGPMYDTGCFADVKKYVEKVVFEGTPTTIGDKAFLDMYNLTDITLPQSVQKIGSEAFFNCRYLTTLVIPAAVTEIGAYAFTACKSVTEFVIPDGVTRIEKRTFSECDALETVVIPETVTSIGESAFYWCYTITEITLPENLTELGSSAFSSCYNLKSMEIPVGITEIPNRLFGSCNSMESVAIPDGVTQIGTYAFEGCSALKEISIPAGVTQIGYGAFSGCSLLTEITIPTGVQKIESRTFYKCMALESLVIPENVTTIGESAFEEAGLAQITIPAKVTEIEKNAFKNCKSMTKIAFTGNAPSIGLHAFFRVVADVHYPSGDSTWTESVRDDYGGTLTWKCSCYAAYESVVTPPTCAARGYTAHICTVCGAYYVDTYVDKTEHIYGEWYITRPATCTGWGIQRRDCVNCDHYETNSIRPSHNYQSVVTPPTCTEMGYTTNTCTDCGASIINTYVNATGHNYQSVVTPATCTEAGFTTHTCSVCGHVLVDSEVPALDHNYQSVVTPATCTEAGFTTHTCSNCGDSYTDSTVDALGHNMSDWTQEGPVEVSHCQNEGCDHSVYKSGAKNNATGQLYASLEEALADAKAGEIVELIADNDESGKTLIVRPGVTLHLGVFDLKADGLIGFSGSYLNATRYSATGDYGKLIVPKENLALTGAAGVANGDYDVIPVWNGEDAYVLANALINDTDAGYGLKIDEENKTISFSFAHKAGSSANNAFFKDGTGDNALKIIIRLEWASENGVAYQDFVYNDEFVGKVSDGGYNYSFILNNYDILNIDISNLKVTAMILTDCGTVTTGTVWSQANAIS